MVKDITVSGNYVTKPDVIYREINIHRGDTLSAKELNLKMAQSEKFLVNTLLFHSAAITDSISGTGAYIFVKVRERFAIDFWHPQLKATDKDINEWLGNPSLYRLTYGLPVYISNLTGQNDKLTLSAIFGWRQTYGIDYRYPYLNKDKTLGIEASFYYQQGHEVAAITESNKLVYLRVDQRFIYHKTSYEADLIYRKKYQVSHVLELGYDYYNVDDTVTKYKNPDYLGRGRSTIHVPRLAYHFTYDMRDYFFYARSGDLFTFSVEQDGLPVILKDINITTFDVLYRKFIPLPKNFYYEGGVIGEYIPQKEIPYIYRSALGYRYLLNGFEHYVSEGNAYAMIENELKYLVFTRSFTLPVIGKGAFNPVPVSVYAKIFTEEGQVFYNVSEPGNTYLNRLMANIGVGLDITSYYDFVMRLECSYTSTGQIVPAVHFTEVF